MLLRHLLCMWLWNCCWCSCLAVQQALRPTHHANGLRPLGLSNSIRPETCCSDENQQDRLLLNRDYSGRPCSGSVCVPQLHRSCRKHVSRDPLASTQSSPPLQLQCPATAAAQQAPPARPTAVRFPPFSCYSKNYIYQIRWSWHSARMECRQSRTGHPKVDIQCQSTTDVRDYTTIPVKHASRLCNLRAACGI